MASDPRQSFNDSIESRSVGCTTCMHAWQYQIIIAVRKEQDHLVALSFPKWILNVRLSVLSVGSTQSVPFASLHFQQRRRRLTRASSSFPLRASSRKSKTAIKNKKSKRRKKRAHLDKKERERTQVRHNDSIPDLSLLFLQFVLPSNEWKGHRRNKQVAGPLNCIWLDLLSCSLHTCLICSSWTNSCIYFKLKGYLPVQWSRTTSDGMSWRQRDDKIEKRKWCQALNDSFTWHQEKKRVNNHVIQYSSSQNLILRKTSKSFTLQCVLQGRIDPRNHDCTHSLRPTGHSLIPLIHPLIPIFFHFVLYCSVSNEFHWE